MQNNTSLKDVEGVGFDRIQPGGFAGLLPDFEIAAMCRDHELIRPWNETQVTRDLEGRPIISYGLSSYGYDIRVGDHFKIFTNVNSSIVDPKNFDPKTFIEIVGDECLIPPNSFALAATPEKFKIPRDILGICVGKSTYARAGIVVNVTPLEPEWEGYLTLEFSNTTNLPAKIYAFEGAAQLLFFRGAYGCETSYADRKGKYQYQKEGPVEPRLKL